MSAPGAGAGPAAPEGDAALADAVTVAVPGGGPPLGRPGMTLPPGRLVACARAVAAATGTACRDAGPRRPAGECGARAAGARPPAPGAEAGGDRRAGDQPAACACPEGGWPRPGPADGSPPGPIRRARVGARSVPWAA